MPSVPTAKVLAPGEGKTIKLFAVRFDDKVTSTDSGGALAALEEYFEELAPVLSAKAPPSEYDELAHRYGLTIQNDWSEELEGTYGVTL